MQFTEIHSCGELMEFVRKIGFLPLLDSGIPGFSADGVVDDDCRYVTFPDGGWDWPLWKWKGQMVTDGDCVYGKFFNKKAGFVSKEWWPDFFNYRRGKYPKPAVGSVEEAILDILTTNGSLITRHLRTACDFVGPNMRSKFDAYITKLEMGCYIVTEDFVYPRDKNNREYGWGWSLLTTPEQLYGKMAMVCNRTPEESYQRMAEHIRSFLPGITDKQIDKLIG